MGIPILVKRYWDGPLVAKCRFPTRLWDHTHDPDIDFDILAEIDHHKIRFQSTLWRHGISALLDLFNGNTPVTGGFPCKGPLRRIFDNSLLLTWTHCWTISWWLDVFTFMWCHCIDCGASASEWNSTHSLATCVEKFNMKMTLNCKQTLPFPCTTECGNIEPFD